MVRHATARGAATRDLVRRVRGVHRAAELQKQPGAESTAQSREREYRRGTCATQSCPRCSSKSGTVPALAPEIDAVVLAGALARNPTATDAVGVRAQRPTVRIAENPGSGRDFVVGDVHGEFPTLERLLERVAFAPDRDRLFALGDLVDRGPQSAEALAWLEQRRFALSVRGNHEHMLLEKLTRALERDGPLPWTTPGWFVDQVPPTDWPRWAEAMWRMPIAATVRTGAGAVGLVHATPTARHWETMCTRIEDGNADTIWLAMNSTARARGDARRAQEERVPVDGRIDGVRAVLTGHAVVVDVTTTANVLHIDTGAGFRDGRLTLARIDTDPIDVMSVRTR